MPTTTSPRIVLVTDTGDPRADAVMDGRPHPLSERFTSLTAAQAVFPAATSLAEQVDRHAVARVLAAGDVALGPGTALLDRPLLVPAGGGRRILGVAPGQTVLRVVPRASCGVLRCADETVVNAGIVLSGFEVDGNRAVNPSASSSIVGIDLVGAERLTVRDVLVHDVAGTGIRSTGLRGVFLRGQTWEQVTVTDCAHWGLAVGLRTREVTYDGIRVTRCGTRTDRPPAAGWLVDEGTPQLHLTGGFLLDHSEARLTAVHVDGNGITAVAPAAGSAGGCGLAVRNVYACNLSGVRACGNGGHGVLLLGLVGSALSDVVAQDNGRVVADSSDVHVHGSGAMNYGRTARSAVTGLVAGPTAPPAAGRGTAYALYLGDGVTDLAVHGARLTPGRVAAVRRPAGGAARPVVEPAVPWAVGRPATGAWTGPRYAATASLRLAAGQARAVPWDVSGAVRVDAVGVGVTAAGTRPLRVALLADDGTGQRPGALLADLGTVPGSAVADVVARAGSPVLLADRRVWVVVRVEGTSGTAPAVRVGTTQVVLATAAPSTAGEACAVDVAGWTAPLADGVPAGATAVPQAPVVRLRVA